MKRRLGGELEVRLSVMAPAAMTATAAVSSASAFMGAKVAPSLAHRAVAKASTRPAVTVASANQEPAPSSVSCD